MYSYPSGKDEIYPVEIIAMPDSVCQLQKFSATRYRCNILSLKEGLNQIFIQVSEEGIPPTLFPIDITYSKVETPSENDPQKMVEVESVTFTVKESKPVRKKRSQEIIIPM
jgi:hypothetical protein